MEKFIRIDMKGHWRGSEHKSSMCGLGEENEELFERGISCYNLADQAEALEKLRCYWVNIASCREIKDYEDKQITIFEGEKIGEGSDWEDIALCSSTVKEIDAAEVMKQVFDAAEEYENDLDNELTEEEAEENYYKRLEEIEL